MTQHFKRITCAALCILGCHPAFGNDRYQQLARAGLEHAYQMQTESAAQVFDDIIRLDPDNPQGYLFQAVHLYYRMQFDEKPQQFEAEFKSHMAMAVKTSQRQMAVKEKKLDAMFYLGTAYLYQATFHGGQNSWLKAYYYGREGINYLEKIVEIAPTYYDAYLGLGLYHYHADVIPKSVKILASLLGIDGDKERGLRELQTAAEKGDYSKAEALFILGNIFLYTEKDYEKSWQYARELIRLHPGNPGFQILLAENLQKRGQNEEAVNVLQKLLEQNQALLPFFQVSIHYNLGNLYVNWERLEEALQQYQQALAIASRS
ncbi:MAG TPA: tetratricopeptide repeat protein, partial [bacterium]